MNFQNLTDSQKGYVFVTIGAILLLYSLGIFKDALSLLVILSSIALILYGFILGDFWTKLNKNLIHHNKKK